MASAHLRDSETDSSADKTIVIDGEREKSEGIGP